MQSDSVVSTWTFGPALCHLSADTRHVLHFVALRPGEPDLLFGCDGSGQVDIDALTEEQRECYLFARAMIGREYLRPRCEPISLPIAQ